MLRVAVIGCGMMGTVHRNGYAKIDETLVKLVATCDIRKEYAEKFAEAASCEIKTYREILDDPNIDAVDICTPTFTHKELVLMAAAAGKHVFCEKPVALSIQDSKDMIEACEKAGVKFGVGHVVRFFPEFVATKRIVENGDIGKPVMARFYRGGGFPTHGCDDWFNDLEKSGGTMVDLSIHDLDYLRKLFGEIETVDARSVMISSDTKIDDFDHCLIILKFANGVIAHIEGSWAEPAGAPIGFGTALEIVGTAGMLNQGAKDSSTFVLQTKGKEKADYLECNPTDIDPYRIELEKFYEAVAEDKAVPVNGYEAMESLRVSLAANLSAKLGKAVKLSEVN